MAEAKDVFEREFLIPALEKMGKAMEGAGIDHTILPGDEGVPGIWVKNGDEPDVFCTLLAVFPEGDEEEEDPIPVLRLSAPADGETGESGYLRWAFPVVETVSPEEFQKLVNVFLSERPFQVIPEAHEAAAEPVLSGEGELIGEEEAEELSYDFSGYAAFARLRAISDLLTEEGELHTGVLPGSLPYLQVEYEDWILTLACEQEDSDGETFLLHIRTDIPYGEEDGDPSEICRDYNADNSFTRAYAGLEPFPVFMDEEEEEGAAGYIALHACVPQKGGSPDPDSLALIFAIFAAEAETIYEP